MGPIAYFLIYNIPAFLVRFIGAVKGYELGFSFLANAEKSGLMEKVMFASGIVGIMVIGAMSKDMFYATIPLEIGASVSGEEVQTVVPSVFLTSTAAGRLPMPLPVT